MRMMVLLVANAAIVGVWSSRELSPLYTHIGVRNGHLLSLVGDGR